jgi:hypothetical protein
VSAPREARLPAERVEETRSGVRSNVHTACALLVVPALVLVPVAGLGLVALWLLLGRARRRAGTREAAAIVAAIGTAVAIMHAASWQAALWPAITSVAVAAMLVRLDAVAARETAIVLGLGAVATAVGIVIASLFESGPLAAVNVDTMTFHRSATAALALVLAAGSSLAWRGSVASRWLGSIGVVAAVVVLLSTDSRSGFVGFLVALAVLGLIGLGRVTALAGSRRAGVAFAAGGAVVVLVAVQVVLIAPAHDASTLMARVTGDLATRGMGWGARTDESLLNRLQQLDDPIRASAGRLAAWKLTHEMIAERPLLGHGFDAVERLYAPRADDELWLALGHPHHAILIMVLQGGTLFAAAVLTLLAGIALRLVRAAVEGDASAAMAAAVLAGLVAAEFLNAVTRVGIVGGPALVVLLMATSSSPSSARRTVRTSSAATTSPS